MALSGSQVTQHGMSGYTQMRYGSFAGKSLYDPFILGERVIFAERATGIVFDDRDTAIIFAQRQTTIKPSRD